MHHRLSKLVPCVLAATSLACAVDAVRTSEPSKWPQTLISEPAPRETIRLLVTQGKKHEPAVGARVRWTNLASSDAVDAARASTDPNSWYSLLDGELVEATSDDQGEVELGLDGKHLVVEVSAGTLWSFGLYDVDWLRNPSNSDRLELQLVPDFDIAVRVIDAGGRPASGAPVCIRCGSGVGGSDCLPWLTDEQGQVTIRHAGNAMQGSYFLGEYTFCVAVAGCLVPPVEHPIDRYQAPPGPIELRLPPTGEVQVVYEERDGAPIPMFGVVGLDTSVDPKSTRATRLPDAPHEAYREAGSASVKGTGASEVTIRHVSLGAQWTAWAQRNRLSEPAHEVFQGPRAAGERVRVVLHPPETALVQGQLVDERGKPRAGVSFSAQVLVTPPSGGWNYINAPSDEVSKRPLGRVWANWPQATMMADASGRFQIDLDCGEHKGSEHYLLLMESQGESRELSALGEIEHRRSTRKVDLGPLKLAPSPLIVGGTIRDDAGHPVQGVQTAIWYGHSAFFGQGNCGVSGADGRFEIRGIRLEKHMRLAFNGEGLREPNLEKVRTGKQNLDVRMERIGKIRGSVQVQEGVAPKDARVRWMALTGSIAENDQQYGNSSSYRDGSMNEDWSFDIGDLPPGTYRVSVWSPGFPNSEEIVKTGVRVAPGAITELGEFAPLKRGRKITLRILGPDGVAPQTGEYVLSVTPTNPVDRGDAWRSTDRHVLNAGAIDVYTEGCIERIEIAVPGCRLERLENISENREIRLRPGLPVKIQLRRRLGSLPVGRTLRLGLVSVGGPPPTSRHPSLYLSELFDESGTAMLVAPDPGKYWIQWIIDRTGRPPLIVDDPDQQLPIADRSEEQSFVREPPFNPARASLEWW